MCVDQNPWFGDPGPLLVSRTRRCRGLSRPTWVVCYTFDVDPEDAPAAVRYLSRLMYMAQDIARPPAGGLHRSNVLGVRFVAEPFERVRRAVGDLIRMPGRTNAYLCPSGVHGVVEAQKDPSFRRILNGATFNVPDGMPIVLASRAMGRPDVERIFGPDIMWAILSDSAPLEVNHFFYGGREGVADRLAAAAEVAFPGLHVCGTCCPPFRPPTPDECDDIARMINESGADVVWVGLSTPKQERWIDTMKDRLDVKLICSVGAAFDYHTGSIKPAPPWMKKAALEWFYRLMQEPGRLWRRYFEIVPKFLFLITLQLSGLKRFRDEG